MCLLLRCRCRIWRCRRLLLCLCVRLLADGVMGNRVVEAILPNIIANATPAMPKKGANLGVGSALIESAIFGANMEVELAVDFV